MKNTFIRTLDLTHRMVSETKASLPTVLVFLTGIGLMTANVVFAAQPTKLQQTNVVVPATKINSSVIIKPTSPKVIAPGVAIKKPVTRTPVYRPQVKAPPKVKPIITTIRKPAVKTPAYRPQVKVPPRVKPAVRVKPQPTIIQRINKIPRVTIAPAPNIGAMATMRPKLGKDLTNINQGLVDQAGSNIKQFAPAMGEDIQAIRDAVEAMGAMGLELPADGVNEVVKFGGGGGITGLDGEPMDISKLDGDDGNGFDNNGFTTPEPTTPIKGRRGSTGSGPLAVPSPKEAMSGATGFDNAAPLGPTRIQKDPDGTITETTGFADGSESISTRHPDGANSVISVSAPDENGIRTITRLAFDKNGNVTEDTLGGVDPAGNPNPDSTDPNGKNARWLYNLGFRPSPSSKPESSKVNPGPEGATPDNAPPRLVPTEEQLTGDPSFAARQQGRGVVKEDIRRTVAEGSSTGGIDDPRGEQFDSVMPVP